MGFQGSETSWVEVTAYSQQTDPLVFSSDVYEFTGRGSRSDKHSLFLVQTNKAMGAASGTFVIELKPSPLAKHLFQQLTDDDWIDITFYRHDQPWHTMRGLVDEIRRSQVVSGKGATSTIYTITGRDFGKVWEQTPIWFSPYANADIATEGLFNKVLDGMVELQGSPKKAVETYLKRFIETLRTSAGPNWCPPDAVPGIMAGTFINNIVFNFDSFSNVPPRQTFSQSFMGMDGSLWSLAQQYSDPAFTELYADLLPSGDPLSTKITAGEPYGPSESKMTVVLRDKPFPVVDADDYNDYWGNVPEIVIPRQQIIQSNLGRSGVERFNAYYVAGLVHQESLANHGQRLLAPLVDLEDIKNHGMRRYDVQSNMISDKIDTLAMLNTQRKIAMNWYTLNPYMISGTLSLGVGRPEIKIGCRVRVPGAVSEDDDESYYVEQVSHAWQAGMGTRTTLGVTRGWIGKDDSYKKALEQFVKYYKQFEKTIKDR